MVVGAVAKGNPTMEVDYITDSICISKYALSASVCLGRITYAFEMLYNIIWVYEKLQQNLLYIYFFIKSAFFLVLTKISLKKNLT